MGRADGLAVEGGEGLGSFSAAIEEDGRCAVSEAERRFCRSCGSPLWLFDGRWPDLVHPHASAIDVALPVPPARTHIMLDFKADWVGAEIAAGDERFARYPSLSIEDWHRTRGLWIA